MIALFALLGTTLVAPTASAMCLYTWLGTSHDTMTPRGWIVITGGGEVRATLNDIARHRPALVFGNRSVPLEVMAVHIGDMNVTQVLLRPSRALPVGGTWRLALDAPEMERERARDWLDDLKWTVEPAGGPAVGWSGTPADVGGSRAEYGCGPAVYLEIATPLHGDPLGVLVEVSAPGRAPTRYLLEVREGRIQVGHGMCSGPVGLARGVTYSVRVISALNRDGTSVPAPTTQPLLIEAP